MTPYLFSQALKKSQQPVGLKHELAAQIKLCRQYLSNARNGAYDYLNSYPCGYQDAHVEKVQAMFETLEVLKLAYAIQSGNAKRYRPVFDLMMREAYQNEAQVILLGVMSEFPGLMHGDQEVDGPALIEFLTVAIRNMTKEAKDFSEICIDSREAK